MRKNIRHTGDDLSRRIADNYIETVRLKARCGGNILETCILMYFEKL